MPTKRLFVVLLTSLVVMTAAHAQPTASNATASASGDTLRFIAPSPACQLRVQILSPAGETVLDSSWRDGNLFDWEVAAPSNLLADGSYRTLITTRDLAGAERTTETTLVVSGGTVSIDGAKPTPATTLVTHDGKTAAIISSEGDLTFRFGDFEARTDKERMRLTADGALIVDGPIRVKQGIVLADGTQIQSADDLSAVPSIRRHAAPLLQHPKDSSVVRLKPQPAVTPASQFKVDSTGVHIGTTPTFGLDVAGDLTLSRNIVLPSLSSSTGVIYGGDTNTPFIHGNSTADETYLGRNAGNFSSTGSYNTGIGSMALVALTSGNENTAVGASALTNIQTGGDNTAVGMYALGGLTSGTSNTAVGAYSLNSHSGAANTTVGWSSLSTSGSGDYNTAIGYNAMQSATSGSRNVAVGESALKNTSGSDNTAIGQNALLSNGSGTYNVATGESSLATNTTGSDNVATGSGALYLNSTGSKNTAARFEALHGTTGSNNIGIGYHAGYTLTTGSNNIDIGGDGVAGESATIRIGGVNQTSTFIGGIFGVTVSGSPVGVLINSNGQLGTVSSSRRYKFDIQDMGDATNNLMQLRPVTFRYIANGPDGPIQYGLIAEEVAEVYPEFVARDKKGRPETVLYQFLAPMLLNELQKEHRRNEEQQRVIDDLTRRLERLERRTGL